ncbi:NAD(P)/FAD-dependent oxidoreductase [Mariniflexile sp.]|uniref:NAD(P)/FAD-dependent oxidoreductase n=1 Tax=Mariniflexile sp. TaxID=1979402 RepID=UPI004048143C
MNSKTVNIIGAGPASLVAAIQLAKNNYAVTVHEMKNDVGTRFNGDFQGIDNWSTYEDAHDFLKSIDISINFKFVPYSNGDYFDPLAKKYNIKTSRPLFYLVERGTNEESLDQGLKRQALKAGVEIKWNSRISKTPEGKVIIGTGPKAADAIAKGIVFETTHKNYYAGYLDNNIAPEAYAYLLVNEGKATFATCLFKSFPNAQEYYDRAYKRLIETVDIDIINPSSFGGYANFFFNKNLIKDNRIYYVGENAGFQDALWGFGMRYAMHSGYLAARSIIENSSYPDLCKTHIIPKMEASLINRWMFSRLGNKGYAKVLSIISAKEDLISILTKKYNSNGTGKKLLFPIAKLWFRPRLIDKQCMHKNCSCLWCKHGKHDFQDVKTDC